MYEWVPIVCVCLRRKKKDRSTQAHIFIYCSIRTPQRWPLILYHTYCHGNNCTWQKSVQFFPNFTLILHIYFNKRYSNVGMDFFSFSLCYSIMFIIDMWLTQTSTDHANSCTQQWWRNAVSVRWSRSLMHFSCHKLWSSSHICCKMEKKNLGLHKGAVTVWGQGWWAEGECKMPE